MCLFSYSWTAEAITASFYDDYFDGKKMANGETFRQHKFTAAIAKSYVQGATKHKLGSFVTLKRKGRIVRVKITDVGNFGRNHIDLSKAAYKALGGKLKDGLIEVVEK